MIAYVDRDEVYRYTNPAFKSKYATGSAALVGQTFEELSGDLYSFIVPYIKGVLGGASQEFEVVGNADATRGSWLRATFIPDVDTKGAVAGFFAVIKDIHDGKTAVLERGRLQHACDQGMEGFALHDAEGLFTYSNPAMASMYGYTTDEVLGKSWKMLYTDEAVRRIEEVCIPEMMERGQWRGELLGRRKSGEQFDVEVTLNLMTDEQGNLDGLTCNSRDITERKLAEESLRQLQRIDAVGQLTSGLAHDFNNLLAIILGNLEFLQASIPEGSDEREMLTEAMNAAENSAGLTKRLLAFAREQKLLLVTVDVCSLIDDMENVLARSLGEHIGLKIEHGSQTGHCKTDKSQLQNAVLNLVLNARDAMAEGGVATIRTGVVTGSATAKGAMDGECVFIAISDTGVGMGRGVRERMFDPFFSTKDPGRGTGLGLSIVHGFVTQSGGRLEVESEPGLGTCVTILLPRTEDVEVSARSDDKGSPFGQGEVVLIVEDTEEVLQVVSRMLRTLRYEVLEARDAVSAIQLARSSSTPIDVVISDVKLPGDMNGDELVGVIKAIHPGVGQVVMSGHFDQAAALGEMPLLSKPFKVEELAQAIRKVL
jgi:PAS domain S-box-containing protein